MASLTFTPTTGSTIDPGQFIDTEWTSGAWEEYRVYVTTVHGETLAFDYDEPRDGTILAQDFSWGYTLLKDGFSGHVRITGTGDMAVSILPAGGWDVQDGAVTVRVETYEFAPAEYSASYTLSSILPIVRDDAHTVTGLDRMLDQFDGSVNLRLLASSYLDQAQSFEDVAYQLINARSLAIVSGDRLDGLGQIVNVPRNGRTDEDYRLRIRAELAILLSQGTTEDLIGVLRLLLGLSSPPDIQIDEYYPKSIFMRARDFIVTEDPDMVTALLRRAASAATNLQFIYTTTESDDDDLFRFSDTNGTSETSSSHGYSNGMFTGAK